MRSAGSSRPAIALGYHRGGCQGSSDGEKSRVGKPMKFDANRAIRTVEELGDPQFGGPDWESRAAGFVAAKFADSGMVVKQEEVEGSAFPQRIAAWVGWLGYGALVTACYAMLWQRSNLALLGAILALGTVGVRFLELVLLNRIRPGGRTGPIERAPLVVARTPGQTAAPVRVVFQAILGDLKASFFHRARPNPHVTMSILHA